MFSIRLHEARCFIVAEAVFRSPGRTGGLLLAQTKNEENAEFDLVFLIYSLFLMTLCIFDVRPIQLPAAM